MEHFFSRSWSRLAGGMCLMALVAMSAASATLAAEQRNPGPVIELPSFVVTDSRELPQPESWRYAAIPGFEILTNASDRATQRLLEDFGRFRFALDHIWPMPERAARPMALIICGRGGKFDAFAPERVKDPTTARASLFLKGVHRDAIVIDLEAAVLNVLPTDIDDPASGVDSSRIAVDHHKQLNREYVRALLSQNEPRLPAWLEEGFAQIMMAMRITDRVIEFGIIDPPNMVSASAGSTAALNASAASEDEDLPPMSGAPVEDRDFNAVLHQRRLIPLADFFAVSHDAPEAQNPLGNNIWAKQAYAFVHLCLFGDRGRFQQPFATYLKRISREPATEELFRECFDRNYKQMQLRIRSYVQFTNYTAKRLTAPKGQTLPKPPPLDLRDATPAEIGRIKGEALLLAGQTNSARTELIAPYVRGERDPDLLAALGLFEQTNRNEARARTFLAAAVAGKTSRPEAYLALARYELADALAASGEGNKLDSAQAAAITEKLLAARQHPPLLPDVYELVLETWLRSERKVSKDDLVLLVEGVRRFPNRLKYVFQVASLCAAAGVTEGAHDLVAHGIARAGDPKTRAAFEALRAQLPPDPAQTSTPAEGSPPATRSPDSGGTR